MIGVEGNHEDAAHRSGRLKPCTVMNMQHILNNTVKPILALSPKPKNPNYETTSRCTERWSLSANVRRTEARFLGHKTVHGPLRCLNPEAL